MRAHATSPEIVGRARELGQLDEAFGAAQGGTPAVVLLGGEAGVGKTRLINEFGVRAQAAGARLLAGGCLELGTEGLPFAPFTAALRRLVRESGVAGIAALMAPVPVGGLGRLLPEFGEPDGDGSSGEARARLFELVLTLLERLAGAGPAVLVIEDAHWADQSTRDLLAFLVRNLGGAVPLLIVVTYRADELHRTHPLRPLLTELGRLDQVRRVELGRLGRAEVTDLVRSIVGAEGTPQVAEQVFTRSEGNPLFVEAMLGSGSSDGELPESLRDLLLAGVQRLPEETQEILRVASGGGARIEHELLSVVAGLDEAALTRGLRPAVAANILVVDGDGYAFRHALIREAIHDDLLPGEHTRLHTRYAEALEAGPELMPARRRSVTLAHHWYAAHDLVRALTSAWHGVQETRKSLAYAESLRLASRVLELWDKVPDAAARIGATHAEVLERSVGLADRSGETETGIRLATSALKEIDDPMRAAHLYEQRGRMALRLGRPEGLDDLRTSVRIAPADPPNHIRSRALATLAMHLDILAGGEEESRAAAEEARTIARTVGDGPAEIQLGLRLAWHNLHRDDDPEVFFAHAEQIQAQAEEIRAYRPLMRVYITRSDVLEMYGRHREATEVARRGVAKAEEYGLARTSGTFIAINLAEPLISLGQWDEALAVIGRAVAQDPPNIIRAALEYLSADVAIARGDLPAAVSATKISWGLIGRGPVRRAQDLFPLCRIDALIQLALGHPDRAFAALRQVLDDAGLQDDSRYALPGLVVAARACAEMDDVAPLAEIRDRAAGMRIYGPVQEADRLTLVAESLRAEGKLDSSAWEAAVSAWDALDRPYELAWASLRAAEAAVAGSDRQGAAARLQQAADLSDRLGTVPLREHIDQFARRSRLPLNAESGSGAEPSRLGLTPREVEVLRLVSEGRSNREIAGALFISAKTASVHVSNILAKLGVSGRGEAAATAHRLHLFDPND